MLTISNQKISLLWGCIALGLIFCSAVDVVLAAEPEKVLSDIEKNGRANLSEKDVFEILTRSYGLEGVSATAIYSGGSVFRSGSSEIVIPCDGKQVGDDDPRLSRILNLYFNYLSAREDVRTKEVGEEKRTKAKELFNEFKKRCSPELVKSFSAFVEDVNKAGTARLAKFNAAKADKASKEEQWKQKQEESVRKRTEQFAQEAIQDANSRVRGVSEYQFGINRSEVRKIVGRPGVCNNVTTMADDYDRPVELGQRCIDFLGKKRDMVFFFQSPYTGVLNAIGVSLDDNSVTEALSALEKKYGRSVFIPTKELFMQFESGRLDNLVLGAFNDWSVIYLVFRNRNKSVSHRVIYQTDSKALLSKTSWQK